MRISSAHVAALLGPFVGLLGEDGADEADDRGPVGEDPDDVGAAADLLVQPFLRVVRPDLAPDLVREAGEREQVLAGVVEVLGGVGELRGDGVDDPAELVAHRGGVGLVEDGAHHGGDPRLRRLGHLGEQVAQVVGAAALPGRAGQGGADRVDQAAVGVGDDQPHPGQAAGGQRAQERQPAGAVLLRGRRPGRGLRVARRR